MKKVFSLVLFVILTVAVSVTAFAADSDIIASGYCGGEGDGTNLEWVLTEDGTLTISGEGEMADYEVDWNTNSPMSNAPWAGYANQINKLVFEEGIEYIGSNGFFRMRNIRQELIIPSSVKVIGREAFAQTSFLGNLVIPEGVEKIEYEAFSYSDIDTAEISSTVTELDTRAFYYCYNLESINVSENNEVYSDIDGVLCSKDKKKLVIFPKGRGEKYRIPDGITVIGEESFAAVEGGVVIGKDVETIAYNAFVLFEGKILLEHQVEYIDSKAFSRWGGNYNKIDIYFINGAPIEVAKNAFLMDEFCTINLYYLSGTEDLWEFDENGLWNGYEVKPFTAYEEVELDPGLYVASGYCGEDLITDGKNLAWVIDENGILTIKGEGEMANYKNEQIDNIWVTNAPWADYADKITKLVVEEGVLSIGDFAFYGIYGLSGSAIELPEGVTRIGTSAFVNSVSSVTIPESMKYFECDSFCNFEGTIIIYSRPEMIERFTFYNEPVSIYFMNGAPLEIMENAFGHQNRIEATLYYYSGTEDLWEFDENGLWKGYEVKPFTTYEEVELDPNLYVASGYCGADPLTDGKNLAWGIDENGTLTIFGKGEMADYETIVSYGGGGSFAGTTAPWYEYYKDVKKIVIESGITYIGKVAFEGLWKVPNIPEIPASVKVIGEGAFENIGFSGELVIPEGVKEIKGGAFQLNNITSVYIPSTLEEFTHHTFDYNKIEKYIVSENNKWYAAVDGSVFSKDGKRLVAIPNKTEGTYVVPEGTEIISELLFNGNEQSELNYIVLPESIKIIEHYCFQSFNGKIIINGKLESIGMFCFTGKPNAKISVYFTNGAPLNVGEYSFTEYGGDIELYYLSGTEDLWSFDENGLWNGYEVNEINAEDVIIASGYCGGEGDGTNLEWTITADGALTISGTGKMADYGDFGQTYMEDAPWKQYKDQIKSLVIEEGVTSIGGCAFYKSSFIKGKLVLPETVTRIGVGAFAYCDGLSGELVIPESVMYIDSHAFFYCRGLNGNLEIGEKVSSLDSSSFSGTGIENISVSDNNTKYCSVDGILYSKDLKTLILCPGGKTGSIVIPKLVERIEWDSFRDCQNLTGSITLPDSIVTIGRMAFESCSIDEYYFRGDAPSGIIVNGTGMPNFDYDDTIYYPEGNATWVIENGKWKGYNAVAWKVPFEIGDINQDRKVDVKDVYLARLVAAKLVIPAEEELSLGDVDGNGRINAIDANLIRKFCANIITKFPVEG